MFETGCYWVALTNLELCGTGCLSEVYLPLSAGLKEVHHWALLEMVPFYQCSLPTGSMLFRHISQINPDGKFVFKSCLYFSKEFLAL